MKISKGMRTWKLSPVAAGCAVFMGCAVLPDCALAVSNELQAAPTTPTSEPNRSAARARDRRRTKNDMPPGYSLSPGRPIAQSAGSVLVDATRSKGRPKMPLAASLAWLT